MCIFTNLFRYIQVTELSMSTNTSRATNISRRWVVSDTSLLTAFRYGSIADTNSVFCSVKSFLKQWDSFTLLNSSRMNNAHSVINSNCIYIFTIQHYLSIIPFSSDIIYSAIWITYCSYGMGATGGKSHPSKLSFFLSAVVQLQRALGSRSFTHAQYSLSWRIWLVLCKSPYISSISWYRFVRMFTSCS